MGGDTDAAAGAKIIVATPSPGKARQRKRSGLHPVIAALVWPVLGDENDGGSDQAHRAAVELRRGEMRPANPRRHR